MKICWYLQSVITSHLVRERRLVYEKGLQVAVLHQLHYNVNGLVAVNNAYQTDHEV